MGQNVIMLGCLLQISRMRNIIDSKWQRHHEQRWRQSNYMFEAIALIDAQGVAVPVGQRRGMDAAMLESPG